MNDKSTQIILDLPADHSRFYVQREFTKPLFTSQKLGWVLAQDIYPLSLIDPLISLSINNEFSS